MQVTGYSDRLSVKAGEAISVYVSTSSSQYEAQLVRLIHGDRNPTGPGLKEVPLDSPINGTYRGRKQEIHIGSYIVVPLKQPLSVPDGFSVVAWIYPTIATGKRQAIFSFLANSRSAGLYLNAEGHLTFELPDRDGKTLHINGNVPLKKRCWYLVACTFDGASGKAHIHQIEIEPSINEIVGSDAVSADFPAESVRAIDGHILLAASAKNNAPLDLSAHLGRAEQFFNGKIDRPKLFGRALAAAEVDRLRRDGGVQDKAPLAAWDFSVGQDEPAIVDAGPNGLHGMAINAPTRAVTGCNWSGEVHDFKHRPAEYGAIHFHDDDLFDAAWDVDLTWEVPEDLESGIYALKLLVGDAFDYIPVFVRPHLGRARSEVLFLVPTLTYIAYSNEHLMVREGRSDQIGTRSFKDILAGATDYERAIFQAIVSSRLNSLYDFHSDGSGVCYASRHRPMLNMRPLYNQPSLSFQSSHNLNEDLYIIDWLTEKGFQFDIATDEDLHHEGSGLLSQYKVVLTGSHPEYYTDRMYGSLQEYLYDGGRLMYLGGNGFYWVTSIDNNAPHLIEVRRLETGSRTWQAERGEYFHSTTGELGGLWHFRGRSSHRIMGAGMAATGFEGARPYKRQPDGFDPRVAWVFEGIGEAEDIGHFGLHLGAAAGFEIDRADARLGTPEHALILASATDFSDDYQLTVEEVLEMSPNLGGEDCVGVRADMVLLPYPGDGAVFSASSISYAGSLSHNDYENNVSKLTENILKGFLSREKLV